MSKETRALIRTLKRGHDDDDDDDSGQRTNNETTTTTTTTTTTRSETPSDLEVDAKVPSSSSSSNRRRRTVVARSTGFAISLVVLALLLVRCWRRMRKRRKKAWGYSSFEYASVASAEYDELLEDTFTNDDYTECEYDSDEESIGSIISEWSRDGKATLEMSSGIDSNDDRNLTLSEANG